MHTPRDTRPASITPTPSVHVRALITWIAIFPLVSIGILALEPISATWHPVLKVFLLTLFVVPLAVYVVVPQLLRAYAVLRRRYTEKARDNRA